MQSKSIQVTSILILLLIFFLLGFYTHSLSSKPPLTINNGASKSYSVNAKQSFTPPVPLSNSAITSTSLIYTLTAVIKDIQNTKSGVKVSLAAPQGQNLGTYNLHPEAVIFKTSNGKTQRSDKSILQKNQKVTINLQYELSADNITNTYISHILIK